MHIFADLKRGLNDAGNDVLTAARGIHWPSRRPSAVASLPSAPETSPYGAGPVLDKPLAAQDASALKDAYAIAIADERIRALGYEPAGIQEAVAAYHADNLAAGDTAARQINNPLVRTALEWTAVYDVSQKIGLGRLQAFAAAHPDWPAQSWFRHQAEARLLGVPDPKIVEAFFTQNAPETQAGKLALAKALKGDGRAADGTKLARALFRESDLPPALELRLKADFGADLTKGDYKYRADRLLYKEQVAPALRAAFVAGPDVVTLAKARAAVIADSQADKAIAAVPPSLRSDPGFVFAEIQKLRRADKIAEAATLMQTAPRDPAILIDADEWWTERRVLARKVLDTGDAATAYAICAANAGGSRETRVDAEFHAGWIALRFLNDPKRAAAHFATAATLAETPTSVARVAYWQARAAESTRDPDAIASANGFYRTAADNGSTYYGQLARQALHVTTDPIQEPAHVATGMNRVEAVRAVELLYAAGEKEAATALAVDAATNLKDDSQLAALAVVITRQQDAHLALTIGKLMGQHGIPSDPLAFPTYGIPPYPALQNSAAPSVVYSVARQESAFIPSVVSKAGAKGLMQMIDATARHTALKAGLPFDDNRMVTDAAFNAQLGAAHLGELLAEQGGSYILTFAAYNAGGGRVKQWIDAYGDPRQPGVDPIDWVERIPFTETRNYVQRVIANVEMYKAIFADRERAAAANKLDHEAKL
jgi:soluble lytic murein transglycosylase